MNPPKTKGIVTFYSQDNTSFSKEKIPDFQSVHREITAITVMMNWCILKPGSTGYMAGEKTEGSLNVPKILAGSKNS